MLVALVIIVIWEVAGVGWLIYMRILQKHSKIIHRGFLLETRHVAGKTFGSVDRSDCPGQTTVIFADRTCAVEGRVRGGESLVGKFVELVCCRGIHYIDKIED